MAKNIKVISNARLGGLKRMQLYGNPGTKEGRSKGGKRTAEIFKQNPGLARSSGFIVRKDISYPEHSIELAEFIGILLGDGSVLNNYQCTISFNYLTDSKYIKFVQKAIRELFLVDGHARRRKGCNGADVVVSSCNLVDFLTKQGIVKGNKVKNQVGVPDWIRENEEYRKACLRGLMDTDGGAYLHSYKSDGKDYKYLKLCFTNSSKPLLNFVFESLLGLRFKAYLNDRHVSIYSKLDVIRYFKEIGSSNSKHIDRFKLHFGEVPEWPNGAAC